MTEYNINTFRILDLYDDCLAHMQANELSPEGSIQATGEIHRYSIDSKKNQPDEWYIAFKGLSHKGNPYLCCIYGSWSTGETFTYKSWESQKFSIRFSKEERKQVEKNFAEAQRKSQEEREHNHKLAAENAQKIWNKAVEADNHPYLEKKGVKSHGLKVQSKQKSPNLIIPAYNREGEIRTLQYIYENKQKKFQKRFLAGGEKKGCYFFIGSQGKTPERLIVTEGYATGSSVYEATGIPVVVAFDSGNLFSVCRSLKEKYPQSMIFIAGDDDQWTMGNPGRIKAMEASCSLCLALPIFPDFSSVDSMKKNEFKLCDFNDLCTEVGPEKVRMQIEKYLQSQKKNLEIRDVSKKETVTFLDDLLPKLELLHDSSKVGFVHYQDLGENIYLPIKSERFRSWISSQYYLVEGKAISDSKLKSYVDLIEAKAIHEGSESEVHYRNACKDGKVYIDLGDASNIVEISPSGWTLDISKNIKFFRNQSMKALPKPIKIVDHKKIWDTFRNSLGIKDEDTFILLASWVIFSIGGSGPYPILAFEGQQGSGKSTSLPLRKAERVYQRHQRSQEG